MKIEDCVNETMPRAEAAAMHAACAATLGGMVPDSQLAHHHETAGHNDKAARLFQRQAETVRKYGGGPAAAAALYKRALACVRRCKESAASQEIEIVLLQKLIS